MEDVNEDRAVLVEILNAYKTRPREITNAITMAKAADILERRPELEYEFMRTYTQLAEERLKGEAYPSQGATQSPFPSPARKRTSKSSAKQETPSPRKKAQPTALRFESEEEEEPAEGEDDETEQITPVHAPTFPSTLTVNIQHLPQVEMPFDPSKLAVIHHRIIEFVTKPMMRFLNSLAATVGRSTEGVMDESYLKDCIALKTDKDFNLDKVTNAFVHSVMTSEFEVALSAIPEGKRLYEEIKSNKFNSPVFGPFGWQQFVTIPVRTLFDKALQSCGIEIVSSEFRGFITDAFELVNDCIDNIAARGYAQTKAKGFSEWDYILSDEFNARYGGVCGRLAMRYRGSEVSAYGFSSSERGTTKHSKVTGSVKMLRTRVNHSKNIIYNFASLFFK